MPLPCGCDPGSTPGVSPSIVIRSRRKWIVRKRLGSQAEWRSGLRAGLITQRSLDRNQALLIIALHVKCSFQARDGVFVWAMPFRTAHHFQRQPAWSRTWCPYHLSCAVCIARRVAQWLAWSLGKWRGARSVTVSYKPPMLVTRVRLPACAKAMACCFLLACWAAARIVSWRLVVRVLAFQASGPGSKAGRRRLLAIDVICVRSISFGGVSVCWAPTRESNPDHKRR